MGVAKLIKLQNLHSPDIITHFKFHASTFNNLFKVRKTSKKKQKQYAFALVLREPNK